MWQEKWDPEGLLSTIPAVGTSLLGIFAGQYMRSSWSPSKKTINLVSSGIVLLVIGVIWDLWFPINKSLWTNSYVVFTGGIAFLLFAAFYYFIDVKGLGSWAKPLIVFGTNSIAVYILTETVARTETNAVVVRFLYWDLFASWFGPLRGSFFYALAYVGLWLGIMSIFYKRRIFIKI